MLRGKDKNGGYCGCKMRHINANKWNCVEDKVLQFNN
jgi:hypothetical protein